MIKTIVIFANSVKHGSHCIAGKTIDTKEWIRPVGDENGRELSDEEIIVQNPYGKFEAKPLQKVKIEFIKQVPLKNQPENYLISNKTWQQNFKISFLQIKEFEDKVDNLWLYGNFNKNDKISFDLIKNNQIIIKNSLSLIWVDKLEIFLIKSNSHKKRGVFKYNNIEYNLAITDPNFENNNQKIFENVYLCISLGEPFNGFCYKLIACIIQDIKWQKRDKS